MAIQVRLFVQWCAAIWAKGEFVTDPLHQLYTVYLCTETTDTYWECIMFPPS